MSIGPPPAETCFKCGALVPHRRLPEYDHDHIPGQMACRPEQYESAMFEHSRHCPEKPVDQESRERLEKLEEQLKNWVVVKEPDSPESNPSIVTIFVEIPISFQVALLEKAKGLGISLNQYCCKILSLSLKKSTWLE